MIFTFASACLSKLSAVNVVYFPKVISPMLHLCCKWSSICHLQNFLNIFIHCIFLHFWFLWRIVVNVAMLYVWCSCCCLHTALYDERSFFLSWFLVTCLASSICYWYVKVILWIPICTRPSVFPFPCWLNCSSTCMEQ